MQQLACDLSLAQMVQYLTLSNRIALQRGTMNHKPPESHTIYEKVFLLSPSLINA